MQEEELVLIPPLPTPFLGRTFFCKALIQTNFVSSSCRSSCNSTGRTGKNSHVFISYFRDAVQDLELKHEENTSISSSVCEVPIPTFACLHHATSLTEFHSKVNESKQANEEE